MCDVRELANGATDHCNSKIRAAVDHVKAGIAQQLRDGGRVIDRIGQSGDVLIGGIADHQRATRLSASAPELCATSSRTATPTFRMKALTMARGPQAVGNRV